MSTIENDRRRDFCTIVTEIREREAGGHISHWMLAKDRLPSHRVSPEAALRNVRRELGFQFKE